MLSHTEMQANSSTVATFADGPEEFPLLHELPHGQVRVQGLERIFQRIIDGNGDDGFTRHVSCKDDNAMFWGLHSGSCWCQEIDTPMTCRIVMLWRHKHVTQWISKSNRSNPVRACLASTYCVFEIRMSLWGKNKPQKHRDH